MFRLFLTPFLFQASKQPSTHGNPKSASMVSKRKQRRGKTLSARSQNSSNAYSTITGKSKSQVLQQHHRQDISKETQERKRGKTRRQKETTHCEQKARNRSEKTIYRTDAAVPPLFFVFPSSEWNLMYRQRLKTTALLRLCTSSRKPCAKLLFVFQSGTVQSFHSNLVSSSPWWAGPEAAQRPRYAT